jgi:hypothetical protein
MDSQVKAPNNDHFDKLQDAIERFNTEQPVMSRFPIKFMNKMELTEVEGGCVECAQIVPHDCFRGTVSTLGGDNPTVVSFDAHAVCRECGVISPIYGRVRVVGDRFQMEKVINGRWMKAFMTPEKSPSIAQTFFSKMQSLSKWLHSI